MAWLGLWIRMECPTVVLRRNVRKMFTWVFIIYVEFSQVQGCWFGLDFDQ